MRKALMYLLVISILSMAVSATGNIMLTTVCQVLTPIIETLTAIGPALVIVMFLYGGAKYVYSADDPGGRKQAKSILVNSIIGGIIILLADWVKSLFPAGGC
jgi:hypothetical protein